MSLLPYERNDMSEPSAIDSSAATCACASCSVRYKLCSRVTPGGTPPPGTAWPHIRAWVRKERDDDERSGKSVGWVTEQCSRDCVVSELLRCIASRFKGKPASTTVWRRDSTCALPVHALERLRLHRDTVSRATATGRDAQAGVGEDKHACAGGERVSVATWVHLPGSVARAEPVRSRRFTRTPY